MHGCSMAELEYDLAYHKANIEKWEGLETKRDAALAAEKAKAKPDAAKLDQLEQEVKEAKWALKVERENLAKTESRLEQRKREEAQKK